MALHDYTSRLACPALMVAATASGQGKTTITAALARLHARQGRRVRVFKCGPDFLDPQIHAVASGQPCHNIDFAMCGEADARWRLARAAAESDLILVEGVMGLHDGVPSAAELAWQLGLPVLLVQNAAAMAGSFGAVAWGLKHYRSGAPITAVLANQVGSEYHARLCRESLPEDIAWYGHLPRNNDVALPERHLGLLPAAEISDLTTRIDQLADLLARTPAADLPPAVDFVPSPAPEIPPLLAGKTIAVARDAAFCFIYPANLGCLVAMGAKIVFFSPLQDSRLPPCDAVWLPGGYPELHAAQIGANTAMQGALRRHVALGRGLLAECGGMISLFSHLHTVTGDIMPLFDLLPGNVLMQPRLAALGRQRVSLPQGALRGHTFHYSTVETDIPVWQQAERLDGQTGEMLYRHKALTASYVHFYFPDNPEAVAGLFGFAP